MSALRPVNEVAVIAGRFPVVERLTISVTPSMAARLAHMTLRTGWTAEQLIHQLLDDALPAPSRDRSIDKGQG